MNDSETTKQKAPSTEAVPETVRAAPPRAEPGQGDSNRTDSARIEPPRMEEQPKTETPRRRAPDARSSLLEEVPRRYSRANSKLKEHLLGSLLVEVLPGKKFIFDWTSSAGAAAPTLETSAAEPVVSSGLLTVREITGNEAVTSDCRIALNESNLMKVISGDLNPQVAMLTSKIRITGKTGLAVYFFNLLVPDSHHS